MAEILEVRLDAAATTREEWLKKIDEAERPFSGFECIGGSGEFKGDRGSYYLRFLLPGVTTARVYTDDRYR